MCCAINLRLNKHKRYLNVQSTDPKQGITLANLDIFVKCEHVWEYAAHKFYDEILFRDKREFNWG